MKVHRCGHCMRSTIVFWSWESQWNWWFNVIFSILSWRCAFVFCMCSDTFCIGTVALKTCAHSFNSSNLKEASHKSFVFIASTFGIWRKHRTKASFSHIMDAIWMLGFARNIVFFRVNGASGAVKSRLASATVLGVVALAWNLPRIARAVELMVQGVFFFSLMMLCYCVLHV